MRETETIDYGMYTSTGDEMINDFIRFVNKYALTDKSINDCLWAISETEVFKEASDTVVREQVFAALNNRTVL